MYCPGSPAWFTHAKTLVTATASASCGDVKAEIEARAEGQNKWIDPHNGGNYTLMSSKTTADGNPQVWTQRTTNPAAPTNPNRGMTYTDKQVFTLVEKNGKCLIAACSESQRTSGIDFSTNYCNILNLYCGRADGCTPITKDFTSTQDSVKASLVIDGRWSGSPGQSDASQCIVKTSILV